MLRNLTVKNYCQHEGEKSFDFNGHTVGIVGRNGSGKSNLAKAISDSLTGKYHKPKNRIITHGQTEGWSRLTFEAGDRLLTVHRDLHSKDAWIRNEVTQEVLADTARGVNAVIQESLRVPQEILDGIIFVGQEDINALLFSKDAERERIAQSFFGVSKAREIESALGAILSEIPQDFDSELPKEIDDLRAKIKQVDDEIRALGEAIRIGSESLLPEEVREEYLEMVRTTNLVLDATERIKVFNSELDRLEAADEDATRELEEVCRKLKGRCKGDIESRLEVTIRGKEQDRLRGSYREAERSIHQQISETERELASIENVDVLHAQYSDSLQSKHFLESVILTREELLSRDIRYHDVTCPVCFGAVDETGGNLMEDQNKLDRIELQKLQTYSERLHHGCMEAKERKSAAIARLHLLQHQLLENTKRIESLPPAIHHKDDEAALRLELTEVATLESQMEMWHSQIRSIAAERTVVTAGIEKATASLSARSYTIERIQEASVAIQNDDVRLAELQRIQHEIAGKSQIRRLLVGDLSKRRTKLENQRRNAEKRDFVSRVRSRFHYTGAPQRVIQSRLSTIGDRINYYLELLGTRYRIEVRDGLRFECIFPEKRVDAIELSGGEKVDLSNSFRLASSESFCSRIGFMILDEPTAWLDNGTVDRMAAVVERLSEIGAETGQQFVFVTHSMPLVPFFDQVIEMP